MSVVIIRIIKSEADAANETKDDKIYIMRKDNNLQVRYTDGDSQKSHTLLLTDSSLSDYVEILLDGLCSDQDPVFHIQFQFPGFPVLLYTPKGLRRCRARRAVLNMATIAHESIFADLPAQELEDDDDSSSVSSSDSDSTDSTDDDLPRLVPTNMAWHHHWGC